MATLNDYRDEQLEKLNKLRDLGVQPYPARTARDTKIADFNANFDDFSDNAATLAGRVLSVREHGKLAFIDIEDPTGTVQVLVREESTNSDYSEGKLAFTDLNLITRGDFIETSGNSATTKTGQKSLAASYVRIISKVVRPMPDKLEDKETRLRRRYLDTALNADTRARFARRAQFWQAVREFHLQHDFLETNVPVLEHTTGGADANPFVTHMDALDEDFYLRISHELPLKRLIGGGYEKVFDIGPRFRNENYSEEHLPEHIATEGYWAYADWLEGKKFLKDMMQQVAQKVYGTLQFKIRGHDVDMSGDWQDVDFADLMRKHYSIDIFDVTLEKVQELMQEHGVESSKDDNIVRGIDKLWKEIRKTIGSPIFLVNVPRFMSPLAKANPENPNVTERLQLIMAGSELINGWSELNDGQEQLQRFIDQQKMRNDGDDEAQMLDIDYVEMLEYGMPPTFGWGFSERVFWFFEDVTAREGVPFPQLRREVSETTKSVYPEVYGSEGVMAKAGIRRQDFSKRIVAIVNKELENWQVANTVGHMSAYHGNNMAKGEFDSGDYFLTKDSHEIPRNSQYPILIKRGSLKDLRKLHRKAKENNVRFHVFIKEMIETTNDQEIVDVLANRTMDEVEIYGVALYGDNEQVNALTKHFQLWG